MKSEYDLYSAITFLLVGLGIGSVLVIVLKPKPRVALEGIKGINSWRTAGLQPQDETKERIA
jgi:hypothetical protein